MKVLQWFKPIVLTNASPIIVRWMMKIYLCWSKSMSCLNHGLNEWYTEYLILLYVIFTILLSIVCSTIFDMWSSYNIWIFLGHVCVSIFILVNWFVKMPWLWKVSWSNEIFVEFSCCVSGLSASSVTVSTGPLQLLCYWRRDRPT